MTNLLTSLVCFTLTQDHVVNFFICFCDRESKQAAIATVMKTLVLVSLGHCFRFYYEPLMATVICCSTIGKFQDHISALGCCKTYVKHRFSTSETFLVIWNNILKYHPWFGLQL